MPVKALLCLNNNFDEAVGAFFKVPGSKYVFNPIILFS